MRGLSCRGIQNGWDAIAVDTVKLFLNWVWVNWKATAFGKQAMRVRVSLLRPMGCSLMSSHHQLWLNAWVEKQNASRLMP